MAKKLIIGTLVKKINIDKRIISKEDKLNWA